MAFLGISFENFLLWPVFIFYRNLVCKCCHFGGLHHPIPVRSTDFLGAKIMTGLEDADFLDFGEFAKYQMGSQVDCVSNDIHKEVKVIPSSRTATA
jgi:hypothetical protein